MNIEITFPIFACVSLSDVCPLPTKQLQMLDVLIYTFRNEANDINRSKPTQNRRKSNEYDVIMKIVFISFALVKSAGRSRYTTAAVKICSSFASPEICKYFKRNLV